MTSEHTYRDSDGRECSLDTLCRREPEWAANVIRHLKTREAELTKIVARLLAHETPSIVLQVSAEEARVARELAKPGAGRVE